MAKIKILVMNTGLQKDIAADVRRQEVFKIATKESADVMFFQEFDQQDWSNLQNQRDTEQMDTGIGRLLEPFRQLTPHCNDEASVLTIHKLKDVEAIRDVYADTIQELTERFKQVSAAESTEDIPCFELSRAAIRIYHHSDALKLLCVCWHGRYRGFKVKQRLLNLRGFLSFLIKLKKRTGLPLVIGGDFNVDAREMREFLWQFREDGLKLYSSNKLEEKVMVIVSKEISATHIPAVNKSAMFRSKLILDHEYFVLELNVPGPINGEQFMENLFIHYRSSIGEITGYNLDVVGAQRHLLIRAVHLMDADTLAKQYILDIRNDDNHYAVALELNKIIHKVFTRLLYDIMSFTRMEDNHAVMATLQKEFERTRKALKSLSEIDEKESGLDKYSIKPRMANVIDRGYQSYLFILRQCRIHMAGNRDLENQKECEWFERKMQL